MKTAKEEARLLKSNIVREEMLAKALISLESRETHWQEKYQSYRKQMHLKEYAKDALAHAKAMKEKREQLLSYIEPFAIHKTFHGYTIQKVFSTQTSYNQVVSEAALQGYLRKIDVYRDSKCAFIEDKKSPVVRYSLCFIVDRLLFYRELSYPEYGKYSHLPVYYVRDAKARNVSCADIVSVSYCKKIAALLQSDITCYKKTKYTQSEINYIVTRREANLANDMLQRRMDNFRSTKSEAIGEILAEIIRWQKQTFTQTDPEVSTYVQTICEKDVEETFAKVLYPILYAYKTTQDREKRDMLQKEWQRQVSMLRQRKTMQPHDLQNQAILKYRIERDLTTFTTIEALANKYPDIFYPQVTAVENLYQRLLAAKVEDAGMIFKKSTCQSDNALVLL